MKTDYKDFPNNPFIFEIKDKDGYCGFTIKAIKPENKKEVSLYITDLFDVGLLSNLINEAMEQLSK